MASEGFVRLRRGGLPRRRASLAWFHSIGHVGRAASATAVIAQVFVLAASMAACGDPLLPADYAGPPAVEVGGRVVRTDDAQQLEAKSPRLALVWLTSLEPSASRPPLFVQPVAFQRSQELRKDWDIGIGMPSDAAKLTLDMGGEVGGRPRVAIGKMVYFDDRDDNGTLDLACTAGGCDLVKAISHEFVVYLDQPLTCEAGGATGVEAKTRLAGGFHHFELSGQAIVETPLGTDLRFVLQPTQEWPDPAATLQAFARQIIRTYRASALQGC